MALTRRNFLLRVGQAGGFGACWDVSHIVGWQEGAAVSSLRAVKMLSARVKSGGVAG